MRGSFVHTDFGVSVGAPSRGVQQAVEHGRKCDIIRLDDRTEILKPAEKVLLYKKLSEIWGKNPLEIHLKVVLIYSNMGCFSFKYY